MIRLDLSKLDKHTSEDLKQSLCSRLQQIASDYKDHDPEFNTYRLGYPNREVAEAFSESSLAFFSIEQASNNDNLTKPCRNLRAEQWDAEPFFNLLNRMLQLIPYDLYIKQEKHYHSLFHLIFKLAGLKIQAEVHTHPGRADAVVPLNDKVLIIEFTLDKLPRMRLSK